MNGNRLHLHLGIRSLHFGPEIQNKMLAAWFLDLYQTQLAHVSVHVVPLYIRPTFVGVQIRTLTCIWSTYLRNLSALLYSKPILLSLCKNKKVFSSIPVRREKSKNIKDIKAEEWFVSIWKVQQVKSEFQPRDLISILFQRWRYRSPSFA